MCRLLDMLEATGQVFLVRLTPVCGAVPQVKPGQYLEALLPDGERIPLSVANRPSEFSPWIELHVHHGPGKRRAGVLLDVLHAGGHIAIEMPKGEVWVDVPLKAPVLLVASGTGVAQSKAVVEAIIAMPTSSIHRISLVWVAHSQQEFYLSESLQRWRTSEPAFDYVLFESRGRDLRELYEVADAERRRINASEILASGSPSFVSGCQSYFESIGADNCSVKSDMRSRNSHGETRLPVAVAV